MMVLHFKEEVLRAEDIAVSMGQAPGLVVFVGEDWFGDVAAKGGRHAEQSVGVLGKEVGIDAGLVVEAVQVGSGDKLDEIAIAFLVFTEENQVIVPVRIAARLMPLLGN